VIVSRLDATTVAAAVASANAREANSDTVSFGCLIICGKYHKTITREFSIADRFVFLVGKLGGVATARFAEELAPLGLRPRHCSVLEWLGRAPMSQLDLARRIGVAPSVVVDMVDELERLGAVRRTRDAEDRRRQVVDLTDVGRTLASQAVERAGRLDAELLTGLDAAEVEALCGTLRRLARAAGVAGG
jgi:DNA-binding MarR family transcriptional regulator